MAASPEFNDTKSTGEAVEGGVHEQGIRQSVGSAMAAMKAFMKEHSKIFHALGAGTCLGMLGQLASETEIEIQRQQWRQAADVSRTEQAVERSASALPLVTEVSPEDLHARSIVFPIADFKHLSEQEAFMIRRLFDVYGANIKPVIMLPERTGAKEYQDISTALNDYNALPGEIENTKAKVDDAFHKRTFDLFRDIPKKNHEFGLKDSIKRLEVSTDFLLKHFDPEILAKAGKTLVEICSAEENPNDVVTMSMNLQRSREILYPDKTGSGDKPKLTVLFLVGAELQEKLVGDLASERTRKPGVLVQSVLSATITLVGGTETK